MIVQTKTDSSAAAPELLVPPSGLEKGAARRGRSFYGLLWCEWFAHSRLLLAFLVFWLVCVWGLPLFTHSGWILLIAGAFALVGGPAYGGGDTIEGCEEFSFSLPATRAERYLARLTVGGGALFLLTMLDLLALGLDLPQSLARLYIDTGLLKPLPIVKPRLLYGLVLAFPFAVFAFSFALAAISHSRMLIITAWLWSLLGAMAITHLAFRYEEAVWAEFNGFCSAPLLIILGLAALVGGYRAYLVKEIGQDHRPWTLPPHFWLWLLMLAAGLALAFFLVSLLAGQYPRLLAPAG
ncbi:MAG: hypothetical protein U1G07_00075 [Verrucomicrobiota bacterium]